MQGGRILVVEDDAQFRRVLVRVLEEAGHRVVEAADGRRAWAKLKDRAFEVVVADWVLPVGDGVALCEQLKSDPDLAHVYFVMLTARDRVGEKVAALDAGADDYLVKPCDPWEIQARVRTGLRVHRLHRQLREAALTDPLTGLRNRRYLDQRLAEEVSRSRRYGSPLSLVLVDLDGFKQVNDRLGHPAGDAALCAAAAALRRRTRAGDVVARVGGDEFAVLLPSTALAGARALACDLEAILERLEAGFGASAGCASLERGMDGAALVAAADRDLYARKRERPAPAPPQPSARPWTEPVSRSTSNT